jgi:hypothetical protein
MEYMPKTELPIDNTPCYTISSLLKVRDECRKEIEELKFQKGILQFLIDEQKRLGYWVDQSKGED